MVCGSLRVACSSCFVIALGDIICTMFNALAGKKRWILFSRLIKALDIFSGFTCFLVQNHAFSRS